MRWRRWKENTPRYAKCTACAVKVNLLKMIGTRDLLAMCWFYALSKWWPVRLPCGTFLQRDFFPGSGHRLNMALDLQSLFGLHVHSCTHWLRPRNPPPSPHLGSYTRALLVSQDRRHLFVTPLREAVSRRLEIYYTVSSTLSPQHPPP